MKLLKLVGLAVLLIFATAMAQEVEKKMQIRVMVAGDGGDEASELNWSSDEMDFDLQDLAVGETQTIESDSGKPIIVTRTEQGFNFDVDGKSVMMPDLGTHGTHMAFVNTASMHEAIDVDADVHVMKAHHPDGVTIVSGKPLDQSVKDSIRSVLISAGNNEEITFIDGSQDGERIIVKKIEVIDQ